MKHRGIFRGFWGLNVVHLIFYLHCAGDRTGSRGWCVFMWNPKWDENPCASKKHVVCKKPSRNGGTYNQTRIPGSLWGSDFSWLHKISGCSSGWSKFRDHCYKYDKVRRPWKHSLEFCEKQQVKKLKCSSV